VTQAPPGAPRALSWKLAAVLVATVACLAWVLRGVEIAAVREALAAFRWRVVAPMALAYLGAYVLRCWRLRLLLGVPIGTWPMLSVIGIGFLAINVLPLRLGEFVRPLLLRERHGLPFGRSLAAVLVERLLDMLALLAMLALVGVVIDLPAGGVAVGGVDLVRAGRVFAGVVSGFGLLAVAAVAVLGERLLAAVEARAQLRDAAPVRLALGFLEPFHEALRSLARAPAMALGALGLTAAIWAVHLLGVWMVLLGPPGLGFGLAEALVVWAITLAAFTALPTPGFFGAHEAGCSAALRLLGVDPSAAATLAVLMHLGQLGFAVLLGLAFMLPEGLSLIDLVRRSRAELAPGPEARPPA